MQLRNKQHRTAHVNNRTIPGEFVKNILCCSQLRTIRSAKYTSHNFIEADILKYIAMFPIFSISEPSWFLSALNSLCIAYENGNRDCFDKVFQLSTSLNDAFIPINIWQYGKWQKCNIDPYLPTKNGQRMFLCSNRNIFWPAIIEKAYAR